MVQKKQAQLLFRLVLVVFSVGITVFSCRLDEFEGGPIFDDDVTIALICDTPFAEQVRGDASFSYSANVSGADRTGFAFVVDGTVVAGSGYDSRYFIEMDELFLNLTVTRNGGELVGLTLTTDCQADDNCTSTEYTAEVADSSFTEQINALNGIGINQTILTVAATFTSAGDETVEFQGTFWELITCE